MGVANALTMTSISRKIVWVVVNYWAETEGWEIQGQIDSQTTELMR